MIRTDAAKPCATMSSTAVVTASTAKPAIALTILARRGSVMPSEEST